jgi:hypothetical protein
MRASFANWRLDVIVVAFGLGEAGATFFRTAHDVFRLKTWIHPLTYVGRLPNIVLAEEWWA